MSIALASKPEHVELHVIDVRLEFENGLPLLQTLHPLLCLDRSLQSFAHLCEFLHPLVEREALLVVRVQLQALSNLPAINGVIECK